MRAKERGREREREGDTEGEGVRKSETGRKKITDVLKLYISCRMYMKMVPPDSFCLSISSEQGKAGDELSASGEPSKMIFEREGERRERERGGGREREGERSGCSGNNSELLQKKGEDFKFQSNPRLTVQMEKREDLCFSQPKRSHGGEPKQQ